jgi:hypothetical protein
LPANGWSSPRDTQSIMFLNMPGMEKLYSGTTISTPSARRIRSVTRATAPDFPWASTSASKGGTSRQSTSSIFIVDGISSPARRRAQWLKDCLRKLPQKPAMSRVVTGQEGL